LIRFVNISSPAVKHGAWKDESSIEQQAIGAVRYASARQQQDEHGVHNTSE